MSIAALFFAALAAGIWFVLLRPVPRHSALGAIVSKTFKPAGTYWQYPVGARPGLRVANPIPISECYVFEVKAEGMPAPVHYPLNTVASEQFRVGQRVQIEYQERSIPVLWKRVYVLDMRAIELTPE